MTLISMSFSKGFQSTLPHGERLFPFLIASNASPFQSTLPHGERPFPALHRRFKCQFQSTLPHGERRIAAVLSSPPLIISIHAPARGATLHFGRCPSVHTISIHAPARGATHRLPYLPVKSYKISIHAPARGATCNSSTWQKS